MSSKRLISSRQCLSYKKYMSDKRSDIDPVVIVHGLFGQKRNWQSIAKALLRELNTDIYAVDLRNHGFFLN